MASMLIIDDNDQVRLVLAQYLQALGHAVEVAADGQQGVDAFQRRPFDVVFCDLFMPEKEGLETIRELRQHAPGLKIIAMSGSIAEGKADFLPIAQRLGADHTLVKPFSLQTILATLQGVGLNNDKALRP